MLPPSRAPRRCARPATRSRGTRPTQRARGAPRSRSRSRAVRLRSVRARPREAAASSGCGRQRSARLRHGDAQPRLVIGFVAREPVERQEARRHRAAVAVHGVEVPGAGESVPPVHCALSREPLASASPAALEDRAAGTRRHARTKSVLALSTAHVGLVGPLHGLRGEKKRNERPFLARRSSIDERTRHPFSTGVTDRKDAARREGRDPLDPFFPHLWIQLWVRMKSLQTRQVLPTGGPH